MRKMLPIFFIVCFITLCFYDFADAGGWEQCKGCYNGNLAPDAKDLKNRYNTADKFVETAKRAGDSLM